MRLLVTTMSPFKNGCTSQYAVWGVDLGGTLVLSGRGSLEQNEIRFVKPRQESISITNR